MDPYLRVSLPIHRIGEGIVAFLLDERDPELAMLASRSIGEPMDVLGPLGRGFDLRPSCQRVLLIAQDAGIAPLVALAAKAIVEGKQVTLVALSDGPDRLYPSELLPREIEYRALGQEVPGYAELRAVLVEIMPWAEQVCAAGPMSLYHTLRQEMLADPMRDRPGMIQAYVFAKMGCGIGVCNACSIEVKRGMRHVCTDGPVFDLYAML